MAKKRSLPPALKKQSELAKKIWNSEMKGKKGKTFADAIKEAAKRNKKK